MSFRTLLENDINFNKKTDSITEGRPSVSGCPGLHVSATMAGRASTLGSRLAATDPCLGHLTPMVKGTRRWSDRSQDLDVPLSISPASGLTSGNEYLASLGSSSFSLYQSQKNLTMLRNSWCLCFAFCKQGSSPGFSNWNLVAAFHLAKTEGPMLLLEPQKVLQERLNADFLLAFTCAG